jgi:hypothetical protein
MCVRYTWYIKVIEINALTQEAWNTAQHTEDNNE